MIYRGIIIVILIILHIYKFNSTFSINVANCSVLSLNIRGIDCNFDKFVLYLASLNYNFDIIVLSECHIQINEHHNADLHNTHVIGGYDKYYTRSKIKYGGVII